MRVGGQRHAPAALPPGMTRYPLYRRLGRPQGQSGWVLKISLSPGFHPRTVQLVAIRYTDYAHQRYFMQGNKADYLYIGRIYSVSYKNIIFSRTSPEDTKTTFFYR